MYYFRCYKKKHGITNWVPQVLKEKTKVAPMFKTSTKKKQKSQISDGRVKKISSVQKGKQRRVTEIQSLKQNTLNKTQ